MLPTDWKPAADVEPMTAEQLSEFRYDEFTVRADGLILDNDGQEFDLPAFEAGASAFAAKLRKMVAAATAEEAE